jgi:hypothetical protein
MTRTHGRCPKASGWWQKFHVAGTERSPLSLPLRCDGMVAPYSSTGRSRPKASSPWVEQFLLPTLRPGDIVAMDNLSSHKGPAVRRAIR